MEMINITDKCEKCPDCQTAMAEVSYPIPYFSLGYRCPKCHAVWGIRK